MLLIDWARSNHMEKIMAARKKALPTRSVVIANTIESAVANLESALQKANAAVTARSIESKKLMTEARRLKKRRLAQLGRKKRAMAANKKDSTAATRKAVKTTTSELAATNKALVKSTAARRTVLQELSGLKESQKKLKVYVKGIIAADRTLAKPKRKRKA